ncbi:hypothetical protein [Mollivirus kamchatka]|nr:hypothetical protein [Mollivirus kamchatka]
MQTPSTPSDVPLTPNTLNTILSFDAGEAMVMGAGMSTSSAPSTPLLSYGPSSSSSSSSSTPTPGYFTTSLQAAFNPSMDTGSLYDPMPEHSAGFVGESLFDLEDINDRSSSFIYSPQPPLPVLATPNAQAVLAQNGLPVLTPMVQFNHQDSAFKIPTGTRRRSSLASLTIEPMEDSADPDYVQPAVDSNYIFTRQHSEAPYVDIHDDGTSTGQADGKARRARKRIGTGPRPSPGPTGRKPVTHQLTPEQESKAYLVSRNVNATITYLQECGFIGAPCYIPSNRRVFARIVSVTANPNPLALRPLLTHIEYLTIAEGRPTRMETAAAARQIKLDIQTFKHKFASSQLNDGITDTSFERLHVLLKDGKDASKSKWCRLGCILTQEVRTGATSLPLSPEKCKALAEEHLASAEKCSQLANEAAEADNTAESEKHAKSARRHHRLAKQVKALRDYHVPASRIEATTALLKMDDEKPVYTTAVRSLLSALLDEFKGRVAPRYSIDEYIGQPVSKITSTLDHLLRFLFDAKDIDEAREKVGITGDVRRAMWSTYLDAVHRGQEMPKKPSANCSKQFLAFLKKASHSKRPESLTDRLAELLWCDGDTKGKDKTDGDHPTDEPHERAAVDLYTLAEIEVILGDQDILEQRDLHGGLKKDSAKSKVPRQRVPRRTVATAAGATSKRKRSSSDDSNEDEEKEQQQRTRRPRRESQSKVSEPEEEEEEEDEEEEEQKRRRIRAGKRKQDAIKVEQDEEDDQEDQEDEMPLTKRRRRHLSLPVASTVSSPAKPAKKPTASGVIDLTSDEDGASTPLASPLRTRASTSAPSTPGTPGAKRTRPTLTPEQKARCAKAVQDARASLDSAKAAAEEAKRAAAEEQRKRLEEQRRKHEAEQKAIVANRSRERQLVALINAPERHRHSHQLPHPPSSAMPHAAIGVGPDDGCVDSDLLAKALAPENPLAVCYSCHAQFSTSTYDRQCAFFDMATNAQHEATWADFGDVEGYVCPRDPARHATCLSCLLRQILSVVGASMAAVDERQRSSLWPVFCPCATDDHWSTHRTHPGSDSEKDLAKQARHRSEENRAVFHARSCDFVVPIDAMLRAVASTVSSPAWSNFYLDHLPSPVRASTKTWLASLIGELTYVATTYYYACAVDINPLSVAVWCPQAAGPMGEDGSRPCRATRPVVYNRAHGGVPIFHCCPDACNIMNRTSEGVGSMRGWADARTPSRPRPEHDDDSDANGPHTVVTYHALDPQFLYDSDSYKVTVRRLASLDLHGPLYTPVHDSHPTSVSHLATANDASVRSQQQDKEEEGGEMVIRGKRWNDPCTGHFCTHCRRSVVLPLATDSAEAQERQFKDALAEHGRCLRHIHLSYGLDEMEKKIRDDSKDSLLAEDYDPARPEAVRAVDLFQSFYIERRCNRIATKRCPHCCHRFGILDYVRYLLDRDLVRLVPSHKSPAFIAIQRAMKQRNITKVSDLGVEALAEVLDLGSLVDCPRCHASMCFMCEKIVPRDLDQYAAIMRCSRFYQETQGRAATAPPTGVAEVTAYDANGNPRGKRRQAVTVPSLGRRTDLAWPYCKPETLVATRKQRAVDGHLKTDLMQHFVDQVQPRSCALPNTFEIVKRTDLPAHLAQRDGTYFDPFDPAATNVCPYRARIFPFVNFHDGVESSRCTNDYAAIQRTLAIACRAMARDIYRMYSHRTTRLVLLAERSHPLLAQALCVYLQRKSLRASEGDQPVLFGARNSHLAALELRKQRQKEEAEKEKLLKLRQEQERESIRNGELFLTCETAPRERLSIKRIDSYLVRLHDASLDQLVTPQTIQEGLPEQVNIATNETVLCPASLMETTMDDAGDVDDEVDRAGFEMLKDLFHDIDRAAIQAELASSSSSSSSS